MNEAFFRGSLSQLIAFYTSPLGKKEVSSSKLALPEYTKHIQNLITPSIKPAMNEYIEEVKILVNECKCKITAQKDDLIEQTPESGTP